MCLYLPSTAITRQARFHLPRSLSPLSAFVRMCLVLPSAVLRFVLRSSTDFNLRRLHVQKEKFGGLCTKESTAGGIRQHFTGFQLLCYCASFCDSYHTCIWCRILLSTCTLLLSEGIFYNFGFHGYLQVDAIFYTVKFYKKFINLRMSTYYTSKFHGNFLQLGFNVPCSGWNVAVAYFYFI